MTGLNTKCNTNLATTKEEVTNNKDLKAMKILKTTCDSNLATSKDEVVIGLKNLIAMTGLKTTCD